MGVSQGVLSLLDVCRLTPQTLIPAASFQLKLITTKTCIKSYVVIGNIIHPLNYSTY